MGCKGREPLYSGGKGNLEGMVVVREWDERAGVTLSSGVKGNPEVKRELYGLGNSAFRSS